MTKKQKEHLFLGTILFELIAILAVGFALFSPLWQQPKTPPVVEQDMEELDTVVVPEAASGILENTLPGPVLTAQSLKNTLANSVIGLCQNITGSPTCNDCDSDATPATTSGITGTNLHCQIKMNTRKGRTESDNQSFNVKHSAVDMGAASGSIAGCGDCGGGSRPNANWPLVEVGRFTSPRRCTEVSSFGPGVFSNYDLQLHLYEDSQGLVIDMVDPKDLYARRYRDDASYDPTDGVFKNVMVKTTKSITLLGAGGTPVTSMGQAVGATLETWEGTMFDFEFFSNSTTGALEGGFPVANPPSGGSTPTAYPVQEGRVTSIKDANGYGVELSYKQWTAQEITEAPDRQWQLEQVTDDSGRTISFSYAAQQVSGRWVISSVTGSDGGTTSYEYTNGMLSRVVRPTGDESTFAYSVDNDTQATVMSISDPALGSCAEQTVFLTNNFYGKQDAVANGDIYSYMDAAKVYNTASLLVRLITNGEGEVEYFNFPKGSTESWVYEGGGKLRVVAGYANSTYFGGEWEFHPPNPNDTYDSGATFAGLPPVFTGEAESTYAISGSSSMSYFLPESTRDETGRIRTYEYVDDFISKVTYSDDSFETFEYNAQKKVTRRQDRDGNVTLYTYDARGNMLTKEVGLVALSSVGDGDTYADGWHDGYYDALAEHQSGQYGSNYKANYDGTTPEYDQGYEDGYAAGSGNQQAGSLLEGLDLASTAYAQDPPPADPGDFQTPEYAIYQWEYYPSGHANEFLKSADIDPNGNQTDYEYDTNNLLIKIKHPADDAGGTRPETTFTYDMAGRLKTSTDPVGRSTERFYDVRGRVVKIEYDDGSTERFFFGTGSEAGLLVKQKDRSGVVTDYEYDNAGRRDRVVYAAATMDLADNETAISDPSLTSEETITYVDGTTQVATRTRSGQTTAYAYDYRGRVIETTVAPRVGTTLTSTTYYVNNQVFAREDAYGRKTYYAYRASDGALIREVKGTHPGFSLADQSAVLNYTRTADPDSNGDAIVTDYLLADDGAQIEVIDGRGISSTATYDSCGRVVESLAAAGTSTESKTVTVYDAVGNVTEIQHPRHFDLDDPAAGACRTVMTYTDRNLLKTRTEAAGTADVATESYTYFLDGRLDTRTDARNNDWETVWATCCARRQASIDPLGNGTISNTDYQGRATHTAVVEDMASHTNLNNPVDAKTLSETTTRYDARGRVAARTVWLSPLGAVDPNDVPIAGLDGVTASDGLTTQMLYDGNLTDGVGLDSTTGQTVAQLGGGTYNVSIAAVLSKLADTTANGGAGITFDSNSPGSATVTINPEEELRVSISDALGRNVCSAVIEPHDGTTPGALVTWNCVLHDTLVTITGFGDVLETASISAAGHITRQRTDGVGRTLQSVDAEDYVTNITYDASGNQLVTRDGNNVGQDCTYDALGRRVQCADTQEQAESVSRSWEYDLAGNVITETDAKNKDTTHVYDTRGRKTSTTDRLAGVTAWAYDAAGNLLSLTDAESQTTSYEYDAAGRKIKETYPDHVTNSSVGSLDYGIVEFAYDPAGRLSVKTDQQGDTCTYNYDLAGRLTSRDYVGHTSGPLAGQSDTDTFTYDAAGRMLTAVSGRYTNTVTFAYDDVGRRATESLTIYGQTYTVGTDYDDEGQVSQLTYPDGSLVDRAYTPRGQLQQITYDNQVIDTRAYDPGGRMTQRTLGNGLVESRTYRPDNLTATINTPGVTSFSYTYDANKNKTAESIGGVMQPYGYTATYDDDDRLATWTRDDTNLTQSWNLSPVGDWTSFTENSVVENRTHGPTHELLSINTTPMTYDAKGNLTTNSNGQTYTWDFDNKLKSATVPVGCAEGIEGTHSYSYDALGRRVSKTVGSATTVFVCRTEPLRKGLMDGQVVAHYPEGAVPSDPSQAIVYGQYVDSPTYRLKSSSAGAYYHPNAQYSVAALSTPSQNVVQRYAYNAYGEVGFFDSQGAPQAWEPSGIENVVNFTGQRYDHETAHHCFRARRYNSLLGVFLTRDPIGYWDGPNAYLPYFVHKGGVDPTGKMWPPGAGKPDPFPWAPWSDFYICERYGAFDCIRDYCGTDVEKCIVRHWDVYHSKDGLIRVGMGGDTEPGGPGLPSGLGVKCFRLKRVNSALWWDKKVGWGVGASKKCKNATHAQIKDCLEKRPPNKTGYPCINNCQTDTVDTASECCLAGAPAPRSPLSCLRSGGAGPVTVCDGSFACATAP